MKQYEEMNQHEGESKAKIKVRFCAARTRNNI